jgi:hypothetical protein
MTSKIYRWAKLSEAMNMLQHKPSKKFLYRTTDKSEATGHADTSKVRDKYNKWSIIEAKLSIAPNHIYTISPETIGLLHDTKSPIYKNHIVMYPTETFDIYVIPPLFHSSICDPKIVSIV